MRGLIGGSVWRSLDDVYLLYRLHSFRFPESLRPAFPQRLLSPSRRAELRDVEALRRCADYFLRLWSAIGGLPELLTLPEFAGFLDPSLKKLSWPPYLDEGTKNGPLGIKEWIPATSRFVRASFARLRRRSPSPHLDSSSEDDEHYRMATESLELPLSPTSIITMEPELLEQFSLEKRRRQLKRRASALVPHETALILCNSCADRECLDVVGRAIEETVQLESRRQELLKAVRSLDALGNGLLGAEMLVDDLVNEVNWYSEEEVEDACDVGSMRATIDGERANSPASETDIMHQFFGDSLTSKAKLMRASLAKTRKRYESSLLETLSLILDDVHAFADRINARSALIIQLDAAYLHKSQLVRKLTSQLEESSASFGSLTAADNAEMEKAVEAIRHVTAKFQDTEGRIAKQVAAWNKESSLVLAEAMARFEQTRSNASSPL